MPRKSTGEKFASAEGQPIPMAKTSSTAASVFYDAVFVPGGKASVMALTALGPAIHFLNEAFSHGKATGAFSEGLEVLSHADLGQVQKAGSSNHRQVVSSHGIVTAANDADLDTFIDQFIQAIPQHRHFDRPAETVPA